MPDGGSSATYTVPAIYESGKRTQQFPRQMELNESQSSGSRTRTQDSETEEPTPILREVAELRREIERMRMERHAQLVSGNTFEGSNTEVTLPPSYDAV